MSFQSDKVINALISRIPTDGPKICDKVNAVYLFEVEEKKGGPVKKWTVDLKNKPGKRSLTSQDLAKKENMESQTVHSSSRTQTSWQSPKELLTLR